MVVIGMYNKPTSSSLSMYVDGATELNATATLIISFKRSLALCYHFKCASIAYETSVMATVIYFYLDNM